MIIANKTDIVFKVRIKSQSNSVIYNLVMSAILEWATFAPWNLNCSPCLHAMDKDPRQRTTMAEDNPAKASPRDSSGKWSSNQKRMCSTMCSVIRIPTPSQLFQIDRTSFSVFPPRMAKPSIARAAPEQGTSKYTGKASCAFFLPFFPTCISAQGIS